MQPRAKASADKKGSFVTVYLCSIHKPKVFGSAQTRKHIFGLSMARRRRSRLRATGYDHALRRYERARLATELSFALRAVVVACLFAPARIKLLRRVAKTLCFVNYWFQQFCLCCALCGSGLSCEYGDFILFEKFQHNVFFFDCNGKVLGKIAVVFSCF